jgi:hypothetical protein
MKDIHPCGVEAFLVGEKVGDFGIWHPCCHITRLKSHRRVFCKHLLALGEIGKACDIPNLTGIWDIP